MDIYKKLQKIQSTLKAPKSQRNDFGKYNYRNCEDILEAVKPILNECGCVLTIGDKIMQVGDRYYIEATATLADSETGEAVRNTAYAREEAEKKGMDASQITGSASSYARKYALNGLFCIDDTKDADSQDNTGKGKSGLQQAHINALYSELNRTGIGLKGVLSCYKVNAVEDMTMEQFKAAMDTLKAKPDKQR